MLAKASSGLSPGTINKLRGRVINRLAVRTRCRQGGNAEPYDAEWSSLAAREAHNLEVTGSNPVSAIRTRSSVAERPVVVREVVGSFPTGFVSRDQSVD